MHDLKETVKEREIFLRGIIREKQEALKKAPAGSVFSSQSNKTTQFYQRTSQGGKQYLNKNNPLIPMLAQKEYNKNVLHAAEKEIKYIQKLSLLYDEKERVEDQFAKLHPAKQPLIVPIVPSDEESIRIWLSRPYNKLRFKEGQICYYTDRGEAVRSKSEVIIANLLAIHGIPYKYECPLMLRDNYYVWPDFTILRIRDRQELYWEHLGLIDKPDYLARNEQKIRDYERAGFFPGKRLILSWETEADPLDTRIVERMIQEYCL